MFIYTFLSENSKTNHAETNNMEVYDYVDLDDDYQLPNTQTKPHIIYDHIGSNNQPNTDKIKRRSTK